MKKQLKFEGLGTHWEIESTELTKELKTKVTAIVQEFENNYSRFKATSLISCISNKTGTFTVAEELVEILLWYQKIYTLTQGIFTPLIGQTLEQSGYDKNYSFKPKPFTSVPLFNKAIEIKSKTEISIAIPVQFDVGGVGKGYLIDKIAAFLKKENLQSFTINGGGDIFHYDSKSLKVGLENPENAHEVLGVIELNNKAVCSSAGNRRKWDTYHHIINPFTFLSPKSILATWVLADTALLADTLSTCLFFVEPSVFKEFTFDYLVVNKDKSALYSHAFKGALFV